MSFAALYFHLPFCESRCAYCDFYSIGNERKVPGQEIRFTSALRRECELRREWVTPGAVETVFFGGGTPTMLDPDRLAWALEPLRLQGAECTNLFEWTTEANPSSIDRAKIDRLKKLGVNRVSMGVQSLDNGVLGALGRVHDKKAVFRALEDIFSAGIENVSVDFLCGVPGQPRELMLAGLREITKFPITHLSVYLLTLKKGHPLFDRLPSEEEQLAELLAVREFLVEAKGFDHYETSNFAREPRYRAAHNLVYWKGAESYLGFGPSAHSYDSRANRRWRNAASEPTYSKSLLKENRAPIDFEETLDSNQREIEKWMLGLRLAEGVPGAWFSGKKATQLDQLIRRGVLQITGFDNQRVALSPIGMFLLDQVVKEIVCADD